MLPPFIYLCMTKKRTVEDASPYNKDTFHFPCVSIVQSILYKTNGTAPPRLFLRREEGRGLTCSPYSKVQFAVFAQRKVRRLSDSETAKRHEVSVFPSPRSRSLLHFCRHRNEEKKETSAFSVCPPCTNPFVIRRNKNCSDF